MFLKILLSIPFAALGIYAALSAFGDEHLIGKLGVSVLFIALATAPFAFSNVKGWHIDSITQELKQHNEIMIPAILICVGLFFFAIDIFFVGLDSPFACDQIRERRRLMCETTNWIRSHAGDKGLGLMIGALCLWPLLLAVKKIFFNKSTTDLSSQ